MYVSRAVDCGVETIVSSVGKVNAQYVLGIDVEVNSEIFNCIMIDCAIDDSLLLSTVESLDTIEIDYIGREA